MTPDDRLRANAGTTALVGLVAAVGLSLFARAELPLSELYPFKAAASFAIVMLLAIGYLREHHPFARFGPANQITTARAGLVVLVASLIGEPTLPVVAASAAAASLVVTGRPGRLPKPTAPSLLTKETRPMLPQTKRPLRSSSKGGE